MPRQTWIIDAAHATGLPVVEVDGWKTRGSEEFSPRGVVWHHTAGPNDSRDMPTLNLLIKGRSDLPGPLANFGLGRSGTVYVIAAGRANHAGSGGWRGLVGNSSVIGIEAEHPGVASVPWSTAQLDAYQRLTAAVCRVGGIETEMVCGHKEWAPTRKVDPIGLDMNEQREAIAALLWMEENMGTFEDVPPTHWAFKDVEWANAKKIVTGYTGRNAGLFGPEDSLTRAQAAAIARRIVRLVAPDQAV